MTSLLELFLTLSLTGAAAPAVPSLRYTLDLNDRADSVFKVTLRVDSLPSAGIFQFASTAPGTYQVMDIGRFVVRFRAFNAAGAELATTRVSTNQWSIASPARVRTIRYEIRETHDTPVAEHRVYRMCGSALKADYAFINGQAVFGFPRGMQAAPISLRLLRPASWTVGTPLRQRAGLFVADDYDQLVDSPILTGRRLTRAETRVTGVPVEILVQSKTDRIKAPQLLSAMRGMLQAAGGFLGKLPVDRYTFLFHFADSNSGAWEHSYGSAYDLREQDYTPAVGAAVTDIAAHEFFHVVTPLNLHSEVIEHFNFETPVPSRHLWLYEGATEWAAHKMQLESGLKPVEGYLAGLVNKIRFDHLGFDTTYSLSKLAITSFSDSGQRQYGNIYMRGAVVAGLLDIKLLELSNGEHGLRDLIGDLSRIYGKKRAFPEDSLFEIVAKRTSPGVRDFFGRYVEGAEHPPVKEYYAKLGSRVIEDQRGLPLRFEMDSSATPAQLKLRAAWLGRRLNTTS